MSEERLRLPEAFVQARGYAEMTPAALHDLREQELHYSFAQMADFLGVTRFAVAAWEKGRNPVPRPAQLLIYLLVDAMREKYTRILEAAFDEQEMAHG